ncbi:MAG: ABC transporter permease [Lachnospiraceae bacterium]|nr:ABC transporter permease [Lachnospiraceae bacterium]
MFIFQNDWKVLPMAAIIAGMVSFVLGSSLFKTMEGTKMGTFALTCVCIWNGFFNSIQVVCRERPIVKREHRSGLHISSYIAAHMIYQAFLCLSQTVIIILICKIVGVAFPEKSMFFEWSIIDIGISLFLITYSADMMALMVSSIVRSTTTAMTLMPFLLIFQLVFSGGFFNLPDNVLPISNITISKWGLTVLCSQGDYNSLPMVSIWNNMVKLKNVEIGGEKPIKDLLIEVEKEGYNEWIMKQCGNQNQDPKYAFSADIILNCWKYLILFTICYAMIAVIFLEFIDLDKR